MIKEKLNRLKWRLFIIWISLRWILKTNLGDIVIYKGKEYFVNNGVVPKHWDLIENKDYYKGRECLDNIPHDLCKKKYTLKTMWRSYKSGYNFYMTNWYGIWCRNGVEDWVRRLKIWNK